MSRVYCPRPACAGHLSAVPTAQVDADRHPERTVFYRVLFHYFESLLQKYENRIERHFGHLHPIVQEVTAGHHETFKAARPPPPQTQLSMAAEELSEYM